MTVTKEQASEALDWFDPLDAKKGAPDHRHYDTLRQFIEQSQDSGHAPAPTDEPPELSMSMFANREDFEAAKALAAPAPAPQQPTDMQAKQAEFAGMHDFLNWNRAQPEPLVKIACEYGVFSKAVALYRAALAGAAPTQAPQQPVAWMHEFTDPHTKERRCQPLRNRPHDYELQPGDAVRALVYATPTEAAQAKGNGHG